jgi:hypothetical protein
MTVPWALCVVVGPLLSVPGGQLWALAISGAAAKIAPAAAA